MIERLYLQANIAQYAGAVIYTTLSNYMMVALASAKGIGDEIALFLCQPQWVRFRSPILEE